MAKGKTRDLRAEREAAREQRAAQKGRRYRASLLPWWVKAGLDRLSPAFVIILMVALVAIGGLMAARQVMQNDQDEGGPVALASDQRVSYDGPVSERWGLGFSPLEELRYSRFGYPLHVGPNGVPLIEAGGAGGEVRELTEMEMEFPSDRDYVMVPETHDVAYAPGHTGHGVRWRVPVKMRELGDLRGVDRVTWFKEQQLGLNSALADVKLGLAQVQLVDPSAWDARWAEELRATVDAINDKYVDGDRDLWVVNGYRTYCEPELDFHYRSGITQGCPSVAYRDAVAAVWTALGEVVDAMRRLADSELLESNRVFQRMYEDADIDEYQRGQLEYIIAVMGELKALVEGLRVYGDAEGDYIHVTLD